MSDLDMRKVKKIPHPLIEEFGPKYADLQEEINGRVSKMTDEEVHRLRLSIESLTDTNCWFIEKDMQPMIEWALNVRGFHKNRSSAAEESRNQTKEKP